MIITDIKRKGKSETYHVYVDDSYFALIEAEYIYKYKIKIGTEIDEQKLLQIKRKSDKLLCSSVALNYISKSLKTEFQLKNYLKSKNYDLEAIDETLEKLKSYGYLNDEYYANISAKTLSKTKGKKYIKNQLVSKGIAEDKINNVLSEIENEDEACFNVAQKWLKGKELPLDIKNKQKLYRFLLARGFGFDVIKSALSNVGCEEVEDDWNWYNWSGKN